MKRLARAAAITAALVLLAGAVGPWLFLSSWVPATGKDLLIRELERSGVWDVSIGTARYDLLRGVILGDVRVVERASGASWAALSDVRMRVGLLSLLVKHPAVQGRAVVEQPLQAVVSFSGRYDLRETSFVADASTTEIPLASITEPLKHHLPPPLKEGTARLHIEVRKPAEAPPVIRAELDGADLVWSAPAWRLAADAAVEATLHPAAGPGGRWRVEGTGHLRRGAMDGMPVVASLTQLSGTVRFTNEQVEIEELNGIALDSPIRLTGTVTLGRIPAVEALAESRVKLSPLANALPALKGVWKPEGEADARAVCRGPTHPRFHLDCLVEAAMDGVTLSGAKLPRPVTRLGGVLRYDAVSRELSFSPLEGVVDNELASLSGTVALLTPARLGLQLKGILPVVMAQPWLPPAAAVDRLEGSAELDVTISGTARRMRPTGHVTLRETAVGFTTPELRLDHLNGTVDLHQDRIVIPRIAVHVKDQPLVIRGVLTTSEQPHVTASIGFSQGTLEVEGHLTPEAFRIEEARVTLPSSRLTIRGTLPRRTGETALSAAGTVALTDLTDLPFLALPALTQWQARGIAHVTAQFAGRFSDLPAATLDVRLRADRLDIRDVPLEAVQVTMEQQERILRARVPGAILADGKCSGELTLDHRGDDPAYFLRADLTGVQLAKLARIVPAWRTRTILGSASTHLLMSGQWGQRASWLGEGWLNASGERLADVPLLDKLFRGLFGVLGDRLGLDSLRRAQITQASFQWRLSQERFRTEDLRLSGLAGTEPVAVYATGSVGLDKTLDFVIEPELSEGVLLEAPTTSTIARTVLRTAGEFDRFRRLIGRHRLTGRLDEPQYRFEYGMGQLMSGGGLLHNLLDVIQR